MRGEIKVGRGALVANAGEHYVVAELLKRGAVAALVPRNVPSIDVLATKGSKTVRIRVKTKSAQYDDWQWVIKKDGTIFRELELKDDFTVLVDLAEATRDLRFYVVPTARIDKWLRDDHERWLSTPGRNGRKHDPENTKRHLNTRKREKDLEQYLEAWNGIWSS